MTRLFLLFCAAVLSSGATVAVTGAPARPNVLFIAVDDLGNVLGPDARIRAITPNLDRLSSMAVTFDRAYCQIPLCNPSRASVMTGLRPEETGVFDLTRHFRQSVPNHQTLPQLFKNHGWYTARVGKIFHYDVPKDIGSNGLDDPLSWCDVINPKGRDVDEEALIVNPTPEKPVSAALSWLAADGGDEEQTDGKVASEAIRLLGEHKSAPFFIAAGFYRPHTPFVAPRRYFEWYPLDRLSLPKSPPEVRDGIPEAALAHNNSVPNYGLSEKACSLALQAYLASVSFVDAQIGRVLDELENLGLSESTIVIVWSDHGYHLGDHSGIWQKRTLFEEATRAPLLIRWPLAKGNGGRCPRIVEFLDIYATARDLAGLSSPTPSSGRSLRPLLNEPMAVWPHPAFSQIVRPNMGKPIMGKTVRTERWRYTEWDDGRSGAELYDHQSDPDEHVNLVNRSSIPNEVSDLKELLSHAFTRSLDEIRFTPGKL